MNVSGIDEEMLEKTNLDVIIVKKTYTRHRQRKRPWMLRRLEREDAGRSHYHVQDGARSGTLALAQ